MSISSVPTPAKNFPDITLSLFLSLPIVGSSYFASDFPGILLHFVKSSWKKEHFFLYLHNRLPKVMFPTNLTDLRPRCGQVSAHSSQSAIRWGFPSHTVVKNPPASAGGAGDSGLIPELGRWPGKGNVNSLHYSCQENSMDRGAWWATVHGVAKSQTQLNELTSLHFFKDWGGLVCAGLAYLWPERKGTFLYSFSPVSDRGVGILAWCWLWDWGWGVGVD